MSDDNLITSAPPDTHFAEVPIEQIDDPERAMRSDITPDSIADLVMSIKMVGLIEPIVVRARGDRYEVVAGHRRVTAAEAAGLKLIPCYVVTGTQEQVEMMKIHENLYRLDVNPYDEANHYARLMKDMKLTPTRIARIINRSEGYVRDRLDILGMDEVLQRAIADGKLTLSVAKQLYRIKDPVKLREMAHYAIQQGITSGLARRWVDENLPQEKADPGLSTFVGDVQNVTPASEQHSECFYCLQPVRLYEAYTVYVHDACLAARKQDQGEEEPQNGQPIEAVA